MPGIEKPIAEGVPYAEFALTLRALRTQARMTYARMAEATSYSQATLSQAANGRTLPTWPVTRAYVEACKGDTAEWESRWTELDRTANPPFDFDKALASFAVDYQRHPDPSGVKTTAEFMEALRKLRAHAGLSLREIERISMRSYTSRKSGVTMALASSTLSDTLNRDVLPSWDFTRTFVTICYDHRGSLRSREADWMAAWNRLDAYPQWVQVPRPAAPSAEPPPIDVAAAETKRRRWWQMRARR
ncbi:helix-turn-helix domain-containing protein [Streptomyces chartreusis]